MIDLTWTNGQKIQIDGKDVLHIRSAYPRLDGPKGASRVIWLQSDLFEEQPDQIAKKVLKELTSLAQLNSIDNKPIWFNGAKSKGPLYVDPKERKGGIKSAFALGDKVQFVVNTPEEVLTVIKASGGKPIPIRNDMPLGDSVKTEIDSLIREGKIWDLDILQIKIPDFAK